LLPFPNTAFHLLNLASWNENELLIWENDLYTRAFNFCFIKTHFYNVCNVTFFFTSGFKKFALLVLFDELNDSIFVCLTGDGATDAWQGDQGCH